jgi:MFS family permease
MRRLVAFACAVVLVDTSFFAALAPLLPDFESELGLSKGQIGLLVSMYALGGIAGAIPAGLLATRLGIRATVLAGLALLALTSVAFGLVESYWLLDLTRFLQGVAGALCWTGALAWLVSATPGERRGEMIGYAMAGAIAGALLGPVLGGTASAIGRLPAFVGVACVAAVLAVVALQLPLPRREEAQPLRLMLTALRSRSVLVGMWLLALPALLFGVLSVLAPLQLSALGWGTLGVAATFFVAAAVEATITPGFGRWSDRRGRLAPIKFGLLGAPAVTLAIPWIDDKWVLSAAMLAAGICYATFWTPAMALMSDGWEAMGIGHGLGFALMNFAWAPGNVVGSAVGGGLAEAAGDIAAYAAAAAVCLVTFMALFGLGRRPARIAVEGRS